MSESVAEGGTGDTGEADPSQEAPEAADVEDAEAEAQLHTLMQEQDPEELTKQLKHWQKVAQRHERAARTNSDAAAKLKQIEDAGKTELQRAVEAQQAAERERDAALMQHSRMMAAAAHDLPPDLIDYLGEGTPEEIADKAEQLSQFIQDAARKLAEEIVAESQQNGGRAPSTGRSRPVESMRLGAAPAGSQDVSAESLFRNLINRD
jgi:hypothetical protein